MPSPGADAPSTVTNGSAMVTAEARVIKPATRKTIVRGPAAATAARRLPGPASSSVVTAISGPPRPPGVVAPNPSRASAGAGDTVRGSGTVVPALAVISRVVRPQATMSSLMPGDYPIDTNHLTENLTLGFPVRYD